MPKHAADWPPGLCLHPFAAASHRGVETYLQPLQELHAIAPRGQREEQSWEWIGLDLRVEHDFDVGQVDWKND